MTIYAETVLGMKYRKKDKNGKWLGGAMYYIEYGLKMQTACHCIRHCLRTGFLWNGKYGAGKCNWRSLTDSFGVNTTITGVVVALVVFIVLSGGIQRIAKSNGKKVVPIMAGIYLLAGIIVIAVHGTMLPSVFGQIFSGAFNLQSATGGISGSVMMIALRSGVSRGIFTNEAGLGSFGHGAYGSGLQKSRQSRECGEFFRSLPIPLSCVPSQLFVFYAAEL